MDLQILASKKKFTAEEKEFLRAEAVRAGVKFEERKNCSNCFSDLALQIYNTEKKLNAIPIPETKYQLRAGVDVIIALTGERINAATITDEWAERLIKAGFKKYFV